MLDTESIPKHIAIIMDGNGRWARQNKLSILRGHNAGMLRVKEVVKESDRLGVKYLTVYAFSTENFKRSSEEVSGIFSLVCKFVDSELDEIFENNVKVGVLGDIGKIPEKAAASLKRAIDRTANNSGLVFNVAINYGGRAEITRAARLACEEIINDIGDSEAIDRELLLSRLCDMNEADLSKNMYADIPDPDLVIRTSGEERISNFLLWQIAYSEFVFAKEYWPEFTPDVYRRCIEEYKNRQRRFGSR